MKCTIHKSDQINEMVCRNFSYSNPPPIIQNEQFVLHLLCFKLKIKPSQIIYLDFILATVFRKQYNKIHLLNILI